MPFDERATRVFVVLHGIVPIRAYPGIRAVSSIKMSFTEKRLLPDTEMIVLEGDEKLITSVKKESHFMLWLSGCIT